MRGIAGYSGGAVTALHLAMRHPGAYAAVYAMAPAWSDGIDNAIRSYTEKETKLAAIAIEIGSDERNERSRKECEHLSDRLSETGIAHEMVVFDGNHDDLMRQRIEQNVLPFFSGVFAGE
jgi:predicted esterase